MILYLRRLAGVRSLTARVEPDNRASLGVARKAGFISVGADEAHEGSGDSPQKEIAMVSQERLDHLAQFLDEHLAYHEACHAVVHHLQGGTIVRLSIQRTDPQEGMQPAKQRAPTESADQLKALRDLVALLVAGEVAAAIQGAPER
jgi:hypothetical protein